jgi:hypothetical protein
LKNPLLSGSVTESALADPYRLGSDAVGCIDGRTSGLKIGKFTHVENSRGELVGRGTGCESKGRVEATGRAGETNQ